MKCPKCNQEGFKYTIPKQKDIRGKKPIKRTNFKAECKFCGFRGEY